ncbi:MAG: hypothetical protein MI974_31340 [Chitinophagales bacterium]|nr:hypothetical protein [Chitinophagales bacterium]
MKINNQHISGGNQQFADTIINNYQNLSEVDRKLIEVIHDNTADENDRKILLQSLDTLKSDVADIEKEESKSRLRSFIDTGISEASKQIVKQVIDSGASYLEGII